jgi:hypothetical protein
MEKNPASVEDWGKRFWENEQREQPQRLENLKEWNRKFKEAKEDKFGVTE